MLNLQKFSEFVGSESRIVGGGKRGVIVGMVDTVETDGPRSTVPDVPSSPGLWEDEAVEEAVFFDERGEWKCITLSRP